MSSASSSESSGRIPLACALLVFGMVSALGGYDFLREWSALRAGLAACALLLLLAGIVMLACGAVALGFRAWRRGAFRLGGAATCISGAVLVTGVLTHTIPCAGPN
jgi:hypothetical protein